MRLSYFKFCLTITFSIFHSKEMGIQRKQEMKGANLIKAQMYFIEKLLFALKWLCFAW